MRGFGSVTLPVFVLPALLYAGPVSPMAAQGEGARPAADTVHVAPPTGEKESDRHSILAALEAVRPGGIIQFAPGTYLIGPIIRISTPEITLLGHSDGTTIRGCDPGEMVEYLVALFACHGFELAGGHQNVRDLTFEYTWHGLFIGCCFPADREEMEAGEGPVRAQPGGHLIEGNTFRYTSNGIRVIGESSEPVVIRENRFIDVYHAIGINGRTVHFVDNDIRVQHAERVLISTHPGDAINILPFSSMLASPTSDHTSCRDNVIARNRIEGYPDGIRILITAAATSCRRNVIRENTIIVQRVPFSQSWDGIRFGAGSDSTVVGIPVRLSNYAGAERAMDPAGLGALIEDNMVVGNHVVGAEGLGIEILHASGNHIAENTITGIRRRVPFPGNTLGDEPERWRKADGSGIWLSPGSDGNEIAGNTFEDIAGYAVVVEGDSNRVELRSASDPVRDLGSGNEVTVRAGETGQSAMTVAATLTPSHQTALADSIRVLAVESMRLWNRLDPDAWLALFADSVRWYYHATSLDRLAVENMVRGLMSFIRDSRYRVVSDPDVVILGPDAAVASFAMIQSATAVNGVELEEPTGLTFVYQRRDGDWKIVRVHESIEPLPDSVIAETILARTRELAAAWQRLDADAYLAWFSDDLIFYFDGARVSRADFEATVRSAIPSLRSSTFEILDPEVEVLGPDAAAISFALREVMVDALGATTDVSGAMTLIWERRQGRWLVVRAHESLR